MSHLGVDVIDYLLLTIYPVIGLFVLEAVCRVFKIRSWAKLVTQGTLCIGFAIAYVTLIVSHWLTSIVLLALAVALLYQARIAKIKPGQSVY
ncbi:MAG: hypothetical protein ACT4N5_07285 [Nitrosopumilaceae archaeon]